MMMPNCVTPKILEIKDKIGLTIREEKNDAGPGLRMCIAAISNISENERARLDKYLCIEDLVKQARAQSYSYERIYTALFSEPNYTSLTKFFAFSNYIGKHFHFK